MVTQSKCAKAIVSENKRILLDLLKSQKKHGIQPRMQKIREKIHPLSLAKEYYSIKLELLINATVTDDTIKFVSKNLKVIRCLFLSVVWKTKKN